MRLIENSEDGIPRFSPEAKLLEPFKSIIHRDKTKNKDKAIKELGFVHFWCVFDSRYDMYSSAEEKCDRIANDLSLEKWMPDELVIEATIKYKELITTRSSRLVEKADANIKKLEDFFDSLNLNDETNQTLSGAYKIKPKDVQDFIKGLPSTIEAIQHAEKLVRKEQEEQGGKKIRDDLGLIEQRKPKVEKNKAVM